MKCKCGSTRILSVSGKVSDLCYSQIKRDGLTRDGGAPYNMNVGGGDYIEFDLCLDCGQNQGTFPVSEDAVNEAF